MSDSEDSGDSFDALQSGSVTPETQIQELQEEVQREKDGRLEDRFVFIIVSIFFLDVMLFSVMPSFGGPIALLVLELLILIPLAKRMGMQEVAQILNRLLDRVANKSDEGNE